MSGYTATLENGLDIYVPKWNATTGFTNLTNIVEILGIDNLVAIAQNSIPTTILALSTAKDANRAAAVLKHMVCEARVNGSKIQPQSFDEEYGDKMYEAIEIFTHVMVAQFNDFFVRGLAKASSPAE